LVWIALPALVIYLGVLAATTVHLRASNRADIERESVQRASDAAARFDGAFRAAAAIAATTAAAMRVHPEVPEADIFAQLEANVAQDPVIYGAAMAFDPAVRTLGDDLFCPYVCRDGEGLRRQNIGRSAYDWHADSQWTWWHEPIAKGRGVWSAPYFDEGAGNVLMITYSAPFAVGERLAGVTTVDVDLESIGDRVGTEVLGGLAFFILTPEGRFVFSGLADESSVGTVFEVAQAAGHAELARAAERMVAGETGVAVLPGFGGAPPKGWESWNQTQWAFFAPMESTGWSVVALMPEREAFASANRRVRLAAFGLGAALTMTVASIVVVSGRLVRPITRLRDSANRIASGDLATRVEGISGSDEIADLGRAFNTMTDDLARHIDRLAAEQAARERLERDMQVARDIQQGLLPMLPPPIEGFDVSGWSRPAEQTGGDYYDWQVLPDGRVAIVLADVTGHGLGPALVTAFCRAYARAVFRKHDGLPEAMRELNGLLGTDLTDSRFITLVAAIVVPNTDEVLVLSAGHGPILHYVAATGVVESYPAHAMPLGVMEEFVFDPAQSFVMRPGDVVALTTDGFFEWPQEGGRMYGTQRLCDSLARRAGRGSGSIIDGLVRDVEAFAGGTAQPDDLTAVIIKRLG
jgi:sigma-B regulation protein RsbU (phosphoserine phosphatase)